MSGTPSNLAPSPAVLVVEDEHLVAHHIARTLQKWCYRVVRASSGAQALEILHHVDVDLALVDINLGEGIDGVETASQIRARHDAAVVFLTAYSDGPTLERALATGPSGYLVKPFIPSGLRCAIEVALHRHRAERESRRMAMRDELTGLYNRRAFFALAEQELRRAQREALATALFFFDLDGLKPINDQLGHGAGDLAIRAAGDALASSFRCTDVVARLGGDEFGALMVGATASAAARQLARVAARGAELAEERELPFSLSLSAGVELVPPGGRDSIEALLARADAEMYRHKHARRRGQLAP